MQATVAVLCATLLKTVKASTCNTPAWCTAKDRRTGAGGSSVAIRAVCIGGCSLRKSESSGS